MKESKSGSLKTNKLETDQIRSLVKDASSVKISITIDADSLLRNPIATRLDKLEKEVRLLKRKLAG